jgi:ABC-type multidrug transport system permease subunit
LSITCIAFLSVMTGQAFGFLIGAAFDDIQVGQAIGWVIILFLMLLGGFFVEDIPVWLSFVQYLSPFSYASNATLQILFQKPMPCDGSGALSPFCNNSSNINDDATTQLLSFASPEDILNTFNVTLSLGMNIGILLVFCFIPRLVAYYLLRRKKAGERE